MAKIRAKLKQLKDADVRFISLVDRAATRIPFRVLKRDKESKMGIDLTSVFKSEEKVKPHVSALVVFAQQDEAVGTQVQEAIKAHGFVTERVQKSDAGETLVYSQGAQPKDVQIVRLSDQTLASVAGLGVPTGWVGDLVEEHGFFPDLQAATTSLYNRVADIVSKSDTPQADLEATVLSYAQYLSQMAILPANCYKLDEAITAIIQKCSCEATEKNDEQRTGHQKTNPATEAIKEETEEDKKKRTKDHPPSEMAPVDEEDDQKPGPDTDFVTGQKAEAILSALKGIETTVSSLATKVEGVVTEQANQKKTLDAVVQKADTLNTTLKATVTAVPVSEDRPAGAARMRVQKTDEDPRTGNFDTAFLRRRR